jgi:hypothetical protein
MGTDSEMLMIGQKYKSKILLSWLTFYEKAIVTRLRVSNQPTVVICLNTHRQ